LLLYCIALKTALPQNNWNCFRLFFVIEFLTMSTVHKKIINKHPAKNKKTKQKQNKN
jgi:hypothetical protein